MLNFCTLFDIKFITQGLLMYESLKKSCSDFHLYIFAFCDESYKILSALNLEYVSVIPLYEFEDEELLRVKSTRTKGEYCWTCSSSAVLYCLKKFNLTQCTYIDADLYFYSDPRVLLEEMGQKSILITEHRYTPGYDQTEKNGKYCVQFISFKNNKNGLKALIWWRNACLAWCYNRVEKGKFGDQKYLDDWTERFKDVHVLKNIGGGVAPWNIHQYNIFKKNDTLYLTEKTTLKEAELIFYHFHSVKISNSGEINNTIHYYKIGKIKQKIIDEPYIQELIKISKKLHKINNKIPIVKNTNYYFKKILRTIKKQFLC